MSKSSSLFDRYLEPVTSVFTREMAEKIVNLPPDEQVAQRIAELGRKADDGTLTDAERAEYEDFVDAGDLIALFKAKARRYLDENAE
jgi:hypothetical protein